MNPLSLKKVFGIISYFPNNDSAYHIETRRERTRRCSELLFKLEELWPDIDIIIIAQNWQDYHEPEIKNKIIKYEYDKLGILGARRELRKKFLESNYDYLIMLDDDAMISTENPQQYLDEIDAHPDSIVALRMTQAPLNLCAVSRAVYEEVDMPEIDAESGQGFEDDLFIAICFSQFPNNSFLFTKGLVSEISLKYNGPGACPSTWARENTYDWWQMKDITSKVVKNMYINKEYTEADFIPQMDAVIPYVDCSDRSWAQDFSKSTGIYNISGVRFRCWNTLKYLFRSISQYMPFVSRIVLIVAKESQVPSWVNRDTVRIVYHDEFIPKQFLPTFNSCTIESFLYRISGLSDRFIYLNDDIFPINKLGVRDFFEGDVPKIDFIEHAKLTDNLYQRHCRAGLDMIASALQMPKYPAGELVRPEHCAVPMLRSTLENVGDMCGTAISKTVTKLRQKQNINQYIYLYYHFLTGNYIQERYRFIYADLRENLSSIRYAVLKSNTQMICLNDSDKIKDYKKTRTELLDIFEEKFPDKCRYEA